MNTLERAQALVYAFMDQTPKTRDVMRACAALRPGRLDIHQDPPVRKLLRDLHRLGYAFTADKLWWLTALGKTTKEAFEAVEQAAKDFRPWEAFPKGTRVFFPRDADYFDHFIVPRGTTATVDESDEHGVWVKVDGEVPGLTDSVEWEGLVLWSPDDWLHSGAAPFQRIGGDHAQ